MSPLQIARIVYDTVWVIAILAFVFVAVTTLLMWFDELCHEGIDGENGNQHTENNHVECGSQKHRDENSGSKFDSEIANENKFPVLHTITQGNDKQNERDTCCRQESSAGEGMEPVSPKQDVQGAVVVYASGVKIDCCGKKDNQAEE